MTMTHKEALAVAMDAFEDAICNGKSEFEATAEEIRAYIEARGLVLVPREPTDAMNTAGYWAKDKWSPGECDNWRELHTSYSEPRYKAMLAAAPDPFAEGE